MKNNTVMNRKNILCRTAMMLLLSVFSAVAAWAQSSVVYIPSENGSKPTNYTASYLPVDPWWGHSLGQQIYTSAEIGKSGKITAIAFYNYEETCEYSFDIYMAHSAKTEFSALYDWGTVKASDKMFSGKVIMAKKKWTFIDLDTPFDYNGTQNLLLTIDDNDFNDGAQTPLSCSGFSVSEQQAMVIYNIYQTADNPVNFDPLNPPTGDIVVTVDGKERTLTAKFPNYQRKNQIALVFETYPKPYLLTVDDVTNKSALVNWTARGGESQWNVRYKKADATTWTEKTGVTTRSCTLTGLDAGTKYEVQVQGVNGNNKSDYTESQTFTTISSGDPVDIKYTLTDRSGDGWGDQTVSIVQKSTNLEVARLTMTRGKQKEGTVTLINGKQYDVNWIRDDDDYNGYSECGFNLTYGNGDEIVKKTEEDYRELQESHTVTTFIADGTAYDYPMPTDLTATDETYQGATLSWKSKGGAKQWQVSVTTDPNAKPETGTLFTTDAKPFIVTGLNPETEYTVSVQSVGYYQGKPLKSRWSKKKTFKTQKQKARARKLKRIKRMTRQKAKAQLQSKVGIEKRYNLLYSQLSSNRHAVDMSTVVVRKLEDKGYVNKGNNNIWSENTEGGSFDNAALIPAKKGSQVVAKVMQMKTGHGKTEPYEAGWIPKKQVSGDPAKEEEVSKETLKNLLEINRRYKIEAYDTTDEEADALEASDDTETPSNAPSIRRGAGNEDGYLFIRHNETTGGILYITDIEIVEPENVEPWTTIPLAEDEMERELDGLTPETAYLAKVEPVYNDNSTGLTSPVTTFTLLDALYLQDDEDNSATLAAGKGQTDAVVLEGRTFYCDKRWNTFCAPFSMTAEQLAASPLEDMTIMQMHDAVLEGDVLKVTFWEVDRITAGKAYLFQYKYYDDNIHNPYFPSVTISTTDPTPYTDANDLMNFVGTFSPYTLTAGDKSQLYLNDNQLWYPSAAINVNAFRGFFQLKTPLAAKQFVLNFSNGTTEIINLDATDSQRPADSGIYTLDGRKLTGKPTQKGIYIMNGKKVVVK